MVIYQLSLISGFKCTLKNTSNDSYSSRYFIDYVMNISYHCFHDVFYIATYIVQPLWSHSRAKGTVYYMYILDVYKTWSTSLKLIRIGHFFISKSLSGTIKQACFLERVGRASLVVLQFFFIVCFKLQRLWCVFWPEDTSASMRPRRKWRMNEMSWWMKSRCP